MTSVQSLFDLRRIKASKVRLLYPQLGISSRHDVKSPDWLRAKRTEFALRFIQRALQLLEKEVQVELISGLSNGWLRLEADDFEEEIRIGSVKNRSPIQSEALGDEVFYLKGLSEDIVLDAKSLEQIHISSILSRRAHEVALELKDSRSLMPDTMAEIEWGEVAAEMESAVREIQMDFATLFAPGVWTTFDSISRALLICHDHLGDRKTPAAAMVAAYYCSLLTKFKV